MTEVLHANVFFFITAIAVIAFTSMLCVVLYHIIKILKTVRAIVDRIEEGSERIAEDMSHLRTYFSEGSLISQVLGVFMSRLGPFGIGKKEKKRKTTTSKQPKSPIRKRQSINAKIAVRDDDE